MMHRSLKSMAPIDRKVILKFGIRMAPEPDSTTWLDMPLLVLTIRYLRMQGAVSGTQFEAKQRLNGSLSLKMADPFMTAMIFERSTWILFDIRRFRPGMLSLRNVKISKESLPDEKPNTE